MSPSYQIECIPNISTADPVVVERISRAIEAIPNLRLHFVDPGISANRTVYTYVGAVESVFEATAALVALVVEHIDMRTQKGVHPRLGALDVCPFVLLDDAKYSADLERRVEAFATEMAERHGLPIYLYENSATQEPRRNLADVRRGEYEGLKHRMLTGDVPDKGPQQWSDQVAKTGGTVMGARPLMVAYNINLKGRSNEALLPIAKKIAVQTRAANSGLAGVKAIGWYLENFDLVQVSCNLTKPFEAGVCEVFDYVRKLAKEYGCEAPSSELIGCIPQSQFTKYTPEELGFGQLKPFTASRILPF